MWRSPGRAIVAPSLSRKPGGGDGTGIAAMVGIEFTSGVCLACQALEIGIHCLGSCEVFKDIVVNVRWIPHIDVFLCL